MLSVMSYDLLYFNGKVVFLTAKSSMKVYLLNKNVSNSDIT